LSSITNLTVMKNDGTTSIVWTAQSGQGGPNLPATWASQTVGSALAHQPTFTFVAKDSGDGETRRLNAQMVFPHLVTDSVGNITVQRKGQIDISFAQPKNMTSAQWAECVSQTINLLTALKADIKSGTAPV
jgi:hypothetical protein